MTDEYEKGINKLVDYIGQTVNFAADQLPDIVEQSLGYGVQVNTFLLIVAVFVVLFGGFLLFLGTIKRYYDESKIIFGAFIIIFGCTLGLKSYLQLMKIETAPKLYVMEELRGRPCK